MNRSEVFSSRLSGLLRQRGLKQRELAEILGVKTPTITRYLQGRIPDAETLVRIAESFGVSVDYLLGRIDQSPDHVSKPSVTVTPDSEYRSTKERGVAVVPILGRIRAGIPLFAEQNVIGEIAAPDRLAGRADYALIVSGDSMSGVGILDGDIVYMARADRRSPGHGDIVAALVGGSDATLKWLIKENGQWWLKAANPKYDPIPVDETVSIQGIYLGMLIERKPRELDPPLEEMPDELLVQRLAERRGVDPDVLDGILKALRKGKS